MTPPPQAALALPNWLKAAEIPRVDVVVSFVLHNPPAAEIDSAVAQVLRSSLRSHVIVVDNSSHPQPFSHAGDDRVTLVRPPRNLGYGRGHNLALALSRGCSPLHLVANSDLWFADDAIANLAKVIESDERIGLVAPQLVYPDGRRQANGRLLPEPWDLIAKRSPLATAAMRRRRDRFLLTQWGLRHRANLPFLTGCFMLFRRTTLEQLGGFDPRFFVFGEDVDLSRRAHRLGRTLLVPDVEVTHLARTEAQPSLRRTALMLAGYARYFNKWGWLRDTERDEMNQQALAALAPSMAQ